MRAQTFYGTEKLYRQPSAGIKPFSLVNKKECGINRPLLIIISILNDGQAYLCSAVLAKREPGGTSVPHLLQ